MVFKRLLPYLIPNYKVYMCFQISKTTTRKKNPSIKCADEVLYIPMLQQKYPSNVRYGCVHRVRCRGDQTKLDLKMYFFLKIFSRIKMKSHFRYDEGNVQKKNSMSIKSSL